MILVYPPEDPSTSPYDPSISPCDPSVSPCDPSISSCDPSICPCDPSISPYDPSISPMILVYPPNVSPCMKPCRDSHKYKHSIAANTLKR